MRTTRAGKDFTSDQGSPFSLYLPAAVFANHAIGKGEILPDGKETANETGHY